MHFEETQKRCRIYAERPDICRIDRQYEDIYRLFMSWDAFVELNQAGCEALKKDQQNA